MTNQSNSVFKSQRLLIIAAIVLKGHKILLGLLKISVRVPTGRNPGVLHMHTHIAPQDRGQGYEVFLMFQENSLGFTIPSVLMVL